MRSSNISGKIFSTLKGVQEYEVGEDSYDGLIEASVARKLISLGLGVCSGESPLLLTSKLINIS